MRSLQDIQLSCVNICFFIASFHHLTHLDERISVLRYIQNQVLATDGLLVFTNWNLLSPHNSPYTSSCVEKYPDGSADFSIKIGKYHRFYHAFSPQEYEKIAQELGMSIRFVSFRERNSLLILQ